MTLDTAQTEILEQGGKLVGPYRRPRNLAANERGSIHDDAVAQKLGFRGGTVAGSIHMEQFPPILVRALGERWFETGGLSCYFRNATLDNEAVRPIVEVPGGGDDAQVKVWMERDDGMQVLEGTASVGAPMAPSLLQHKLAEPRDDGELRMLAHLAAGTETEPLRVTMEPEIAARRLGAITEPLPWYTGASPWGGAVLNPGLVVHLMVKAQARLGLDRGSRPAVGLYGAIEVQHLRGPVFADRAYDVAARVLRTGVTPKTEYLWYETTLSEPGGTPVARMLMMLRFMKASSPLWSE
jgi:hypothetical protein